MRDESRTTIRLFTQSLGSAACLDVLLIRGKINKEICEEGKNILIEIVSMLVGLIKSNSNRIYEDEIEYKP